MHGMVSELYGPWVDYAWGLFCQQTKRGQFKDEGDIAYVFWNCFGGIDFAKCGLTRMENIKTDERKFLRIDQEDDNWVLLSSDATEYGGSMTSIEDAYCFNGSRSGGKYAVEANEQDLDDQDTGGSQERISVSSKIPEGNHATQKRKNTSRAEERAQEQDDGEGVDLCRPVQMKSPATSSAAVYPEVSFRNAQGRALKKAAN
jgi:hypothetical protein